LAQASIKPVKSQSIVHKNSTNRERDIVSELAPAELTNQSKLVNTMDLRQQTVLSTVSLPSLGGRRRVHQDGIMMLDNHLKMQETENKYKIMENRLKRLEEEEKRA
jgi:hypothetical protein